MTKQIFIVTAGARGFWLATVRRLDAAIHWGVARTPLKDSTPVELEGVNLADSVATHDAITELMQSTLDQHCSSMTARASVDWQSINEMLSNTDWEENHVQSLLLS